METSARNTEDFQPGEFGIYFKFTNQFVTRESRAKSGRLIGFAQWKSGQIFAFPQRFLTVEYLAETQTFFHGKSGGYFKFSNEFFRWQKARRILTFFKFF